VFQIPLQWKKDGWHNSDCSGVERKMPQASDFILHTSYFIPSPRVSVHTLGCKLNYAETSSIAAEFVKKGFSLVDFGQESDIFVLNTCSVTENAERECRQIIRRTLRKSPNTYVVVTGCYAQLRPEEIASIDGVDLVLGTKEKFDVLKYSNNFEKGSDAHVIASEINDLTDFNTAVSSENGERTRAFLKVQDGCDYSCSFCTIPEARGASRSADIDEIVRRARILSSEGFHEIVLSGVNVGDFGRKSGTSFDELALALKNDPEITTRIRISSIEPNLLTDEIIDLVANSSKFCPHFHIPMQSGSDKILRLMQRRYLAGTYGTLMGRLKSVLPNACIGADVIVGFPGETDADFAETCDFIRSLDISYLHVFTYSERPGTKASTMKDSVPTHVRRDRNRLLRVISEKKKRAFYASQIGREVTILLEKSGEDGYSENYVRCKLSSNVEKGAELVQAKLLEIRGDIVIAEPLEVLAYRRKEETLLPIL
jgi:threonylcarbamoyladenosine tRNA methylthiotransferase MtaB